MSSWSSNRRLSYAAIVLAVVVLAAGSSVYFLFHKTPSCFDGIQNGDEFGIDCGGSCTKLCQSAFLPPSVSWTRFKQVAPHLYNVAAYVINSNPNAGAANVPYHIEILDAGAVPLADLYGTMTLSPGRNTMVFRGAVDTGIQTPAKAFFEFTAAPTWSPQADRLAGLTVTNKQYKESVTGSSLLVTIANGTAKAVDNVTVYVVLKDADGNAIDFSKTAIDEVPPLGSADAPFTWPASHSGAVVSIEVLPVAE